MINTKQCKQCGRTMTLPNFRRYYPRGAAAQKRTVQNAETKVGYNTICKECEAFNAKVNRIYKSDKRTQDQQELLNEAAEFYKKLASRGLEPKGRYATDILASSSVGAPGTVGTTKDSIQEARNFMNSVLVPSTYAKEELVVKGHELLEMELTQEPEVYQELVDKWREQIVGPDGRVSAEYLDLFNAVAERIDTYEDNYTW